MRWHWTAVAIWLAYAGVIGSWGYALFSGDIHTGPVVLATAVIGTVAATGIVGHVYLQERRRIRGVTADV